MIRSLYIKTEHAGYWLLMMILCMVVIARNVVGLPIPLIIYLAIGIILCLLCNKEEILAFMCSMAPFESTFQFRYMLLIACLFLVIKSKQCRISNFIPIVLIAIWDALHYISGGVGISSFVRGFAVFMALGIVLMEESIDCSDGLPMRSLAVMTLFSCVVTILVNKKLTGYSFASGDRLGENTYQLVESFNALLNSNVGSFLCVLSICGIALLQRNNNKSKIDIPLMIALSFFINLFQSKSALISLTCAITIYLYANNRNWILPTLKVLSVVFLLMVVGFTVFRGAMLSFISRFFAGDISTGRFAIFRFYHNFLISDWGNILFGLGLHDYSIKVASFFSPDILAASGAVTYINHHMMLVMSHNNIQEILIIWGIPGLLLVIWLFWKIVKHKKMKRNIMHYLAFIYILLYTLQGQLVSSSVVMIGLIFALICMEYQNSNSLLV